MRARLCFNSDINLLHLTQIPILHSFTLYGKNILKFLLLMLHFHFLYLSFFYIYSEKINIPGCKTQTTLPIKYKQTHKKTTRTRFKLIINSCAMHRFEP